MPRPKKCQNCKQTGHKAMDCTNEPAPTAKQIQNAQASSANPSTQPGATSAIQALSTNQSAQPGTPQTAPANAPITDPVPQLARLALIDSVSLPSGSAPPGISGTSVAGSSKADKPGMAKAAKRSTPVSKSAQNFTYVFAVENSLGPVWTPTTSDSRAPSLPTLEATPTLQTKDFITNKGKRAEYQWRDGLRNGFGVAGLAVSVIANYVAVNKTPAMLYQYQIRVTATGRSSKDLSPVQNESVHKKEKRQILEGLAARPALALHRGKFAFEDHENLWSIIPLFDHTSNNSEADYASVPYTKANGAAMFANVQLRFFRNIQVTQSIQSEAQIPVIAALPGNNPVATVLTTITTANTAKPPNTFPAIATLSESALTIRGLNALVAAYASSQPGYVQQGLNKFFIKEKWEELSRGSCSHTLLGFFSSIRPGMSNGQVLLNLNTATKVFVKPMLVSDFIRDFEESYEEALRGLKVRIVYERPKRDDMDVNSEKNRIKTVTGFGELVSRQTFSTPDNPRMRVTDYFSRELGILPHRDWEKMACVNIGSADAAHAVWIPPTHLEILRFQPLKSGLTKSFADAIVRIACRRPDMNLNFISGLGLRTMGIRPPQPTFGPLDLSIGAELLKIPARFLTLPQVRFTHGKVVPTPGASWNLDKIAFVDAKQVTKLGVMNLKSGGKNQAVNQFVSNLQNQLYTLGLGKIAATVDNISQFPQNWVAFQSRIQESYQGPLKGCQVVVVLLPDRLSHPYVRVVADIQVGVATVCCYKECDPKCLNAQYAANVAMKVNAKLGGRTHDLRVDGKEIDAHKFNGIMVVGADVSHPGPGSADEAKSYAGVVASVDNEAYTYLASARPQGKGEETIVELDNMITERLVAYADKNGGELPSQILFYRDGVSESQYQKLRDAEIPAVYSGYEVAKRKKPTDTNKKKTLQLTFVVVGKRHHTRFYPAGPKNRDRNGNNPPGLVVDQVVTSSTNMDFYLQSHGAIQGTARSSHYYVLRNEMRWTADRLQTITLLLCFNFARATKGISICAPARYADLLCDRLRAYASTGVAPGANPWNPRVGEHMFYV